MKVILLGFFLLPFFVVGQSVEKKQFEIKGKIEGLDNGSPISVTDANNPSDTLSSGIVKDGNFNLKGQVKEPNLYHLNFTGAKKKYLLFLGNDKIDIKGNVNDFQSLAVKGSPSNDDFILFQKVFNPLAQRYMELNQKASTNGTSDSVSKVMSSIYDSIENKLDQFIDQHRSSYVSPFVLIVTSQLNEDNAQLQKRFNSLDTSVQQGYFGRYLKEKIDASKIGAVGSEAIDFTQADTSGTPVTLSSFKGKYVLLDFWASWCAPCRMENPNVVTAYNKFKNKNFTVLGVSLDRSKAPWLKAIKDDKLTWTHISDLKFWYNEVAVKYKVDNIPQNFLIGPDGKIVARNLRGPALEAKLCELLGCN